MIFVPSEHTKQALLKTAQEYNTFTIDKKPVMDILISEKIRVIPHGFDPEIFKPKEKKDV